MPTVFPRSLFPFSTVALYKYQNLCYHFSNYKIFCPYVKNAILYNLNFILFSRPIGNGGILL